MIDTQKMRQRVVDEAMSWAIPPTPYHSCADVKGAGVDCAMLLVRVYCDLGIAPAFDPRPYAAQWYLHRDEPVYLQWLERYARQIDCPQPGDVALYNFGRHAAHGAIIVDEHSLVHAYQPAGRVILDSRSSIAYRLHSCWSPWS